MKKKLSKILQIVLPLALGLFLIWYAYSRFTPEQLGQLRENFLKADYTYIWLSMFFGAFSHISRALRWNYLLQPLGHRIRTPNSIMAVSIGYLLNFAIPRSGEVSRALVATRYDKVPFEKAFGTIVAERIADLLISVCILFTALFLQFDILWGLVDTGNINPGKIGIIAGAGLILALVCYGYLKRTKSAPGQKIKHFISGLKEGVLSILSMKHKGPFILHTLFIWAMYVLMFYICIFAFPETQHLSFSETLSLFVVGSFTIAFTNGGFGTYPFLIAGAIALYGIDYTIGTSFGWIVWISQTAVIVALGSLSFLMLPVYNKSR
ncbi:lysylphosphatidylglycerol synthase transmembrane domain-containing protein [Sinomicrobium soli]|uniref:lysylphosphatidylglycerol synthase transmembrane domain-containing protein n=1 Tax=Sinomicrobium sp. N-1-3-6 TaxID=2219864 RepID=UPI001F2E9FED|nr:lysylphosphatidylglycerol synthase transmembrane domain-containing protein [Sinomicrobium sp. N-1-3-6]